MAQNFAKTFYHSDKWKRCKNAYIQQRYLIDGGLCEECHNEQGYIVHHKIYLNKNNINDPLITLNPDNLEYVCKRCHDKFEGHGVGKSKQKSKAKFNSNGEPVDVRPHPPI